MTDMQGPRHLDDEAESSSRQTSSTIRTSDPAALEALMQPWNMECTQLNRGAFEVSACVLAFDGFSVARVAFNQSVLYRGRVPENSNAILIPAVGHGGRCYVRGDPIDAGRCARVEPCAHFDVVTHGPQVVVALALDKDSFPSNSSITCETGTFASYRVEDVIARIEGLLSVAVGNPATLRNAILRTSVVDQVVAALSDLERAVVTPVRIGSSKRLHRRAAVARVREYIHARLPEPMRVSDLCAHANLRIRALEYGFREVTGLAPLAYIRALRFNAARKQLLRRDARLRSISEIAMDAGFSHLSQFSVDYRAFFGESPTQTRKRAMTRCIRTRDDPRNDFRRRRLQLASSTEFVALA